MPHRNRPPCACSCGAQPEAPRQTLDELAFERGVWSAAQYGECARLSRLLDAGAAPDARDAAGYTALHYAARNGRLEACRLLAERGAAVDARTRGGQATALHRAAYQGNLDVVKFLIGVGADHTAVDADGRNVLHRAAMGGHENVCGYLLDLAPELASVADRRESAPLDYVSLSNHNIRLLFGGNVS